MLCGISVALNYILKWLYFKPEERSKQGSFYSCLAANITKYAPCSVQTAMPLLVGDRVTGTEGFLRKMNCMLGDVQIELEN